MGLHTNWLKTKIQNIGTGDTPITVYINKQAVEALSKFTYLGSDIDSEGYSYPEINKHLGMASFTMSQLDNVWRQSTKVRIYKSLVQSAVLYGSETWITSVDNIRIQRCWHDFLRLGL